MSLPRSLHLDAPTFRVLLEQQGPSLGLWRAAEVAVLREQTYERPILDLGCGDGLVISMVLPRVEIGVDPDPKPLAQAKARDIYDRLIAEWHLVKRDRQPASLPSGQWRCRRVRSNLIKRSLSVDVVHYEVAASLG